LQGETTNGGASDDFAVAWRGTSTGTSTGNDIYIQRFHVSGAIDATPLKVDTDGGVGSSSFPAIAMNHQGDVAVAWANGTTDGVSHVYARYLSASANSSAGGFLNDGVAGAAVQTHVTDVSNTAGVVFSDPRVAIDSRGQFVPVWLQLED